MAKLSLVKGTTSYIAQVFIQDSSSTTGAGLTGLVFNSGSMTAYYHRDTDTTATVMTLVTMTVGTWTSLGFKEIDATNMPGWYQLGIPNAALATGAKNIGIHLKGATNMAPLPIEIELTATDNQDAVRGGMTALPNAAAEAAGGLYTRGTGAGQINQAANGQIDANLARILNTAVATPATAGVLDVNIKNMNNIAATAITTINANVGTTQPINFTGTAGSALAKSDMVDIAGAAVSTTTAQIGANAVQVNGQTTSAAGTVTFPGSIASPTNITAGTITTVTNLTNAPTAGDLTATMKTSVTTAATAATPTAAAVTGAVGSVTGNVGGNVVGSVGSVTAGGIAAADKTGYRLSATGLTDIRDIQLLEVYAADGSAPTLNQAIMQIQQFLTERAISATTLTVKKLDGSTTAMTFTLDSATSPTSITRAT